MRTIYEAYFRRAENDLLSARYPWDFRGDLRRRPAFGERLDFVSLTDLIPRNWRSDARYFLVSNLYEMVIAPYFYGEDVLVDRLEELEAWSLIKEDTAKIVKLAEVVAVDRDRNYVSATSVAIALGRLAPELKTTSLQIWGPRGK